LSALVIRGERDECRSRRREWFSWFGRPILRAFPSIDPQDIATEGSVETDGCNVPVALRNAQVPFAGKYGTVASMS